jgi:NTP pyrophosphatase (non-canonical NTP hydrolase)
MVTESNELLELLRFKSDKECAKLHQSDKRTLIKNEIADVFYSIMRICQTCDIDLSEVLIDKIAENNA